MKFFWVLCISCGLGPSAVAIDREAFTFTKYDLEIRLEPQQQRLGARGKVTLRNDSKQPQKIAVLQISSSLAWRSVKVGDKAVQFISQPYVSDIDHTGALSEAIVTLPVEVKPKESVELAIGYEGTITLDATRLTQIGVPEDIAKHTSWDQISPSFTAVRGAGYVAWYPIATEAADFSAGNSMFQVADRWRAREAESAMAVNICSDDSASAQPVLMGDLVRGIKGGSMGGSDHPKTSFSCVAHRFERVGSVSPTLVLANFKQLNANGSLTAQIHVLAGHEAGGTTYSDAAAPASLFVTEWFGVPTTPIAIVDLPDPHAAPFESGAMLLASMAGEESKLAEINLVHELVHGAFSSPRPWVNEGLAHFAEAMYREQKQDGRTAALDFLGIHRSAFLETEKDVSASPQKNPGQPLATTFDESYYRSKAAYVWWMLRDMIGDAALKAAIRKYRAEDDKDPKYVEQLIAAAAPKRDLGWFFDDWVYHDRGLPNFRVLAAHPWKNEKGTQIVTVTIENLGGAGAEVPFTVRFEGGEIAQRIEVRAKSTATTRVEVRGTATEVVVNDGSVPESDLTNNIFKISEP
jgi:hypothetical protein